MCESNLNPSLLSGDKLCPVTVDDILCLWMFTEREMLLGNCCLAAGGLLLLMIDLSRLEGPWHGGGSL